MANNTIVKVEKRSELKKLRVKAAILDELIDLIEEKYLGHLMVTTEKEKSISLSRAEKLLQ